MLITYHHGHHQADLMIRQRQSYWITFALYLLNFSPLQLLHIITYVCPIYPLCICTSEMPYERTFQKLNMQIYWHPLTL